MVIRIYSEHGEERDGLRSAAGDEMIA
jgi:hypothetical protein